MRARRRSPRTPAIDAALDELKQIILAKYPDAVFEVQRGIDEPDSFELDAIVDLENGDEVLDLVIDRVLDMQLKDGLPIHVIPLRPSTSRWEIAARAAAAASQR